MNAYYCLSNGIYFSGAISVVLNAPILQIPTGVVFIEESIL